MLDAAGPGLALELVELESQYVQVGLYSSQDGSSESLSTDDSTEVGANSPPSNLLFGPIDDVDEGGVALLRLTFEDPDLFDVHSVDVDWGDGAVETFEVSPGARFFSTSHQYLDDDPTATPADQYTISVTVADEAGQTSANTTVTVLNVAPSNVEFGPIQPVDENGAAQLQLTFDDVGTLDAHMIEVDWGDGNVESFNVSPGARFFATSHQYLDDDPSGTSSDAYDVTVTVQDDDLGAATGSTSITVNNVAPSNIQFAPLSPIDENGIPQLQLTFDDPGTLDAHQVDVDWGDGNVETFNVSPGGRFVATTHQYLDDDPSVTTSDVYDVQVRVTDDDGGQAAASTAVTVNNVAPLAVVVQPAAEEVDEGSVFGVGVEFGDPGALDTFEVEIDWGDGHVESFNLSVGSRFLATQHIYADNGEYTINVAVIDDDSGVGMGMAKVRVLNVAPALALVNDQELNEGELLNIADVATFTDPGFDNPLNTGDPANGGETEETFTYDIDWGDGTAPSFGFGTIDQVGSPGVLTAGSFNGQHTYADNGVYTVAVTLNDDDGGMTQMTFLVTVGNVDPTVTEATTSVSEGQFVSLSDIGVFLTDPGFDNPLNNNDPSNGGEVAEMFTATTIDWGDGTPTESLAIVNRVSGSPGEATTAAFDHAPHVYADNGLYTVTVMVADDDGALAARTFTIEVTNVAPTLGLTDEMFVINEGDTLLISNLGTFTDLGFDNPLNTNDPGNGSEVEETFTYSIDWGDGSVDTGQLPARRVSGSPGAVTKGTLANSHTYVDNDADNRYTITVTLMDDDGGTAVESFEVTVFNVNPTLDPITATDVDRFGKTTLNVQFVDPGADTFEILVDWGDKLSLPPDDRFVVETVHAGPTPESFTLMHSYSGPPDPLHPAADIVISVKIHDDDFGTPMVFEIGESNVEMATITNPGIGTNPVFIDTTPQVPRLTFAPPAETGVFFFNASTNVNNNSSGEFGGAGGDTRAASERFFALRVIHFDGTESPAFRLPDEAMDDLPALFARLPDNHYAIYLVRTETNTWRLVLDVFVRNGKVIDPGDDTEGSRDRPPTDDAVQPPAAIEGVEPNDAHSAGSASEAADPALDEDAEEESDGATDQRGNDLELRAPRQLDGSIDEPAVSENRQRELTESLGLLRSVSPYRAALAGAAVALGGAGLTYAVRRRRATVRSTPEEWRRLRISGYFRRKK